MKECILCKWQMCSLVIRHERKIKLSNLFIPPFHSHIISTPCFCCIVVLHSLYFLLFFLSLHLHLTLFLSPSISPLLSSLSLPLSLSHSLSPSLPLSLPSYSLSFSFSSHPFFSFFQLVYLF